ncbi:MAG: hypothetical protein EHM81_06930 [Chloroflexi bacterium]|nr:MAG: hypothetical protein EHM81_06930 [Chloroflexota bacterium]
MPKTRFRLALAVVALLVSASLLAWSLLPGPRVVRRQQIQPVEMQLPAPGSFVPLKRSLAWEGKSFAAERAIHGATRFVLIC